MAATATPSTPAAKTIAKHNVTRRRRLVGRRRRVDDNEDVEDDDSHSALDLVDDDSLTEESRASDDQITAHNSDTSNIDEASPTGPVAPKGAPEDGQHGAGNGVAAKTEAQKVAEAPNGAAAITSSGEAALPQKSSNAPTKTDASAAVPTPSPAQVSTAPPAPKPIQPAIVSSSSIQAPRKETAYEKQRREHDLYKQKRDQDPAFVPNRGAFFMHDHRGAGPAANGFRPFGRPGRGGGRGRGGFVGSVPPIHGSFHNPTDPSVSGPWAHDMHDVVAQPVPPRLPPARRQNYDIRSQYGGSQYGGSQFAPSVRSAAIPTCPPSAVHINRSMSVEKQLGTVTLRVFFPPMKEAVLFEKFKVTQYTKLPDHRPPLRRDKAVVIDLPGYRKHQIFPAVDRSFIFIPRALRPNQQRTRGNRTHSVMGSVMGSVSGFSRRTSVLGAGSYYNGSMYSPSVALSRRSSIAQDVSRDFLMSPAGSVVSRPAMAMDNTTRPIVRLPPMNMPHGQMLVNGSGMPGSGPMPGPYGGLAYSGLPPQSFPPPNFVQGPMAVAPQRYNPPPSSASSQPPPPPPPASTLSTVPPPQHHPLPQKPMLQENRQSHNLPMHQPRPQKAVSVGKIETPSSNGSAQPPAQQQPYSMPFHQQVPIQVASENPPSDFRSRDLPNNTRSVSTPLSQIPERAIHAAPFQPSQPGQPVTYVQPSAHVSTGPGYYVPANGYMIPQNSSQPGYLYQTPLPYAPTMPSSAVAPTFVPGGPPLAVYQQPGQGEATGTSVGNQHSTVAREANGMVFYMDPSQMSSATSYPPYAGPVPQQSGYMPGAGGVVTSADGYYYMPQPSMIYYPQ